MLVRVGKVQLGSIPGAETLRSELLKIPGVSEVGFSSLLPYQQSNSSFGAGADAGDENQTFPINQVNVDENFLAAYDIPLVAGRNLDRGVGLDTWREDAGSVNVLVNQLAVNKLGFASAEAALGREFFDFPEERPTRAYRIVGVMPDQNFQGFHNSIKPMVFFLRPDGLRFASIRVQGRPMAAVLPQVEQTWERLVPAYPIQTEFLDVTFSEVFNIYQGMSAVLAGFAGVALVLSLIGLFGLAAFMAQSRTREIGIRKVMGASIGEIVRFLIWQFSKPVMWSVMVALPLAYLASNVYLNFFAERIGGQLFIIAGAGVIAVLVSWLVVSVHAWSVARMNPVYALRYE